MMKKLYFLIIGFLFSLGLEAQTADGVVQQYLKKLGGDKLKQIESVKINSIVKANDKEIQSELIKKVPNKFKMTLIVEGSEFVEPSFNGQQGWATNFMTFENERMNDEAVIAIKSEAQDFPDVFYNYTDKGYVISLSPDQEINGDSYFVVNLRKDSILLAGKKISNEALYFFNKNTKLLSFKRTVSEFGPTTGMMMETIFKDYRAVDGILFPYETIQRVNGIVQVVNQAEAIEVNAEIDDSTFDFPE